MTSVNPNPLVITRIFDAPRERVWNAWTQPEQMKKWWGPATFSAPFVTIDFRVGGKYHFCMRGQNEPGGPEQDFWSTGTYKEIVPMEKIVCTDSFSNEKGDIIPGAAYGMPDMPEVLTVTIVFEDVEGGKTKMTLTHEGLPAGQMSDMTGQGWNGSFDKLAASLS